MNSLSTGGGGANRRDSFDENRRKSNIGGLDLWEELVAATPSQRNWRGIAISLLVILAVIALVTLAVVSVAPSDSGPRLKGRRITLDDIIDDKFAAKSVDGHWVSDKEFLFRDQDDAIAILDLDKGTKTILISNNSFRMLGSRDFSVSSDLQLVLIKFNQQPLFRHSAMSQLALVSVANDEYLVLGNNSAWFRAAVWAATSSDLAVVDENNDLHLVRDGGNKSVRLTHSGRKGVVFNGVADWLYEEEILACSEAIWFAPDDNSLVYARFDDSAVDLVLIHSYDHHQGDNVYPSTKKIRYPKAGSTNPKASLHVVDLIDLNKPHVHVRPPSKLDHGDHYFVSVSWQSEETLSVIWTDRLQRLMLVTSCTQPLYICREIYERVERSGWWLSPPLSPLLFSSDSFLTLTPTEASASLVFPHIKLVSPSSSVWITHGPVHVTQILAWDQQRGLVYYMSTLPESPGVRHLHVTSDNRVEYGHLGASRCITCHTDCEFNEALLSPNFSFFVHYCLGPAIPSVKIRRLDNANVTLLMEDNSDLRLKLRHLALPRTEALEVQLKETDVPARVRLVLPPGLREEEGFTLPLVLNVYGGPGSQAVNERWHLGWDWYLAGNRDMIVAHVDVRGSDYSGLRHRHAVFRNLGENEAKDILQVIQELKSRFHFINPDLIAIWGWSFGGFLALKTLAEDSERLLTCAIAVAPVTKWNLYDSAYTERFLGLPDDRSSWRGYSTSDLTTQASKFKNKSLLLVHGTADDNVHLQQTLVFSKALVKEEVLFRQQIYPDENHSLEGVRRHQLETMERFLDDCFGPLPDHFSNLITPTSGLDQLQMLFEFSAMDEGKELHN